MTSNRESGAVEKTDKTRKCVASSRLGPAVASETSPSSGGVFSRLGSQQSEPEPEVSKSPNKNVYDRLGGVTSSAEPQEQRISSTSESLTKEASRQTKGNRKLDSDFRNIKNSSGILKKRGVGDGSSMSRSRSAPNIISLKPQASGSKLKKRISFGKDEIRLMDSSPGIKSRLGFGRCSSPPPPEIDEPSLQTELKKIAVGKGQFEIRKVMKVVNEKLSTLRDSVTPERKTDTKETKPSSRIITMKNSECKKKDESDYKVDKVDLALRAAKLQSNLDLRRGNESHSGNKDRNKVTVSVSNNGKQDESKSKLSPGKRLWKVGTLEDGTRIQTLTDYDDPILETVPIKKIRLDPEEAKKEKKIVIADRVADDFTVSRSPISRRLSESGSSKTLAQRACMAVSKHQSVSPERTRGQIESVRVRDRVGSRERDSDRSNDRSSDRSTFPARSSSIKDRIGGAKEVHGAADKSIFSRLGSRL